MTLQYQGKLTPDVLVCGGGCAGTGDTNVTTTSMAMGESAGMAVRSKSSLPELDHFYLRDMLALRDAGSFTDHKPATVRRQVQIRRGWNRWRIRLFVVPPLMAER